jgi:cytochrome P450
MAPWPGKASAAPAIPVVACPQARREFLRDPIGCMRAIYQTHGKIAALVRGANDFIFAFGSEFNRELLANPELFHATGFLFPGPRKSPQRRLTHGLFSMNGEQHRQHRRLLLPLFQKKAIEPHRDALVAITDRLLDRWQPGQTRDVSQEMMELTLRVTSQVLFGFDDYPLAAALDTVVERWLALSSAVIVMGALSMGDQEGRYDEMLQTAGQLEGQMQALLEKRSLCPSKGDDILSLLSKAHAEDRTRVSDMELVGQAVHFYAAANHTTKDALTWTLFLLAQHPEVMADLHDELVGKLRGAGPTIEQMQQLPLLENVINESMRLLPPVPYYSRVNTEPAALGSYSLPRGTTIVFSHYITHHMADLYPQPERFRPERWQTINPSPYEYLPFGAGPRMCVGAMFAMMTLKISLAMILQRFRLTVVPQARIDRKVTTTLWPSHGMPMILCRQDRQFTSSPVCGDIHEMVELPATTQRQAVAA